jgi:Tol biopolymer transport system component
MTRLRRIDDEPPLRWSGKEEAAMTRVLLVLVTSLCVAMGVQVATQSTLSAEALLKSATNRELVDRDLDGAADQYKQIAATFAGNHAVASKALLQLGGIYERLGRPEAEAAYERIVTDYPDTGATLTAALARLSAIQERTAGPFKSRDLDGWLKDTGFVTVSPDGRYLAYSRNTAATAALPEDQQRHALFLRELTTGRERLLAEPKLGEHDAIDLQWSPDGRYLAFEMYAPSGSEYRLMTIATRESRTIAKSAKPQASFVWSPDARWLAFDVWPSREGPYEHHVVGIESPAVDLGAIDSTRDGDPQVVWSPDSHRIAYPVPGDQTTDTIRIVTIATKASASIAIPKANAGSQLHVRAWTRGGEIEFLQSVPGGNDFFLVDPTGGAPRKICEGRGMSGGDPCDAHLSPDGQWQITNKKISGGGRIVLRKTSDGSEHPLTTEAALEVASGFSPDGRLLAFYSNRDGSYAEYVAPLDQLPVAHPIKIAPGDSVQSSVAAWWTPTGLVIGLAYQEDQLYRVDLDPRTHRPVAAPVRLTHVGFRNSGGESISPDGHRIAYTAWGSPSGFAVMDANGANERMIKEVPSDMIAAMDLVGWLSSEELLLAEAGSSYTDFEKVPTQLVALNVSTGQTRPAGPSLIGRELRVFDGGNVFFEGPNHRFLIRPVSSAGPVRDVREIEGVHGMEDYKALSRDGKWLAYSTSDSSAAKGKPVPGDIRLRSLETGAERVLAKYADSHDAVHIALDFSPDAKLLLYADPLMVLNVMSLDTGESWPLVKGAPAGVVFDTDDGTTARWSPDGSYVVVDGHGDRTSWRAFEGVTYDAVTKILAGKK